MNGKKLCMGWQMDNCHDPCSSNQLHACAAKTNAKGRVCGMRNHRGMSCKNMHKGQ